MINEPNCSKRGCKHFIGFGRQDKWLEPEPPGADWHEDQGVVFICKAFPNGEGIPKSILYGRNHHLKPVKGDHGILFEPKSEASDANK